jgi:hypothetical protein
LDEPSSKRCSRFMPRWNCSSGRTRIAGSDVSYNIHPRSDISCSPTRNGSAWRFRTGSRRRFPVYSTSRRPRAELSKRTMEAPSKMRCGCPCACGPARPSSRSTPTLRW